jgi:hypothetical protein
VTIAAGTTATIGNTDKVAAGRSKDFPELCQGVFAIGVSAVDVKSSDHPTCRFRGCSVQGGRHVMQGKVKEQFRSVTGTEVNEEQSYLRKKDDR